MPCLSACGVDVVALKRSIAFGLLRSRAQAYQAISDAVTPRSDVDYSLSPRPRSSVHTACARTQVTFGPATLAPMTGLWAPVKCLSCVDLCMFTFVICTCIPCGALYNPSLINY